MPYTTIAPVDENSVHPTRPGVSVPYLPPGSGIWIWVIGSPPTSTAPPTSSELAIVSSRLNALETNDVAIPVKTYYSQVSITNAEATGRNSFPVPLNGNSFFAVLTDVTNNPIRTQQWRYQGIGAAQKWDKVSDTTPSDNPATLGRITTAETKLIELQTAAGSQVEANVTVKYETSINAPIETVLPNSILALDPANYGNGAIVRIVFHDAFADYSSDGTDWSRNVIRAYTTAGAKPPNWPHPTAWQQTVTVNSVEYFPTLRDGGNILVDPLDVTDGKENWNLPNQQYGNLHQSEIMHLAIEDSEWRLLGHTGRPLGGGGIGGVFTVIDISSLTNLQADPRTSPAFLER